MTWMRLPDEYTTEDAKFLIFPVPYEQNPTYGGGATKGPDTIIAASEHLEYYDERHDAEPFLDGIRLLDPVTLPEKPEAVMDAIGKRVAAVTEGKFLLTLGGDHAVTIGAVKGFEERTRKRFSVLILDAHSDFRYSREGLYNHACVARRLVGKRKVGIVGVRSQDIDEAAEIVKNDDVEIIKAWELGDDKIDALLSSLEEDVYLSIDVDVFDPSVIKNTGTPEPGGLSWETVMRILEKVFAKKNVIAADIVEFTPQGPEWNHRAEAFTLAKLAYSLFALKRH